MLSDRDRLIELIQNAVNGCARHWAEIIADHLLSNGVIVRLVRLGRQYIIIFSLAIKAFCHLLARQKLRKYIVLTIKWNLLLMRN